jgi:molybdopterin converting factor small subunit
MKVQVKLFAVARQVAGRDVLEIELGEPATVAALRETLAREVPGLAPLWRQAGFAVDARYAPDAAPIPPGADVACIPPVSGG